jgi:hypothetical protein
VFKDGVLLFDGFEAPAFECAGLDVANRVLHRAFAVGVTHPGRIGHHPVVLQLRGVKRVQFGLVQIGFENAFRKVVEHHLAGAAAEIAPGLPVQLGPDFLAGLPDHAPKAAP